MINKGSISSANDVENLARQDSSSSEKELEQTALSEELRNAHDEEFWGLVKKAYQSHYTERFQADTLEIMKLEQLSRRGDVRNALRLKELLHEYPKAFRDAVTTLKSCLDKQDTPTDDVLIAIKAASKKIKQTYLMASTAQAETSMMSSSATIRYDAKNPEVIEFRDALNHIVSYCKVAAKFRLSANKQLPLDIRQRSGQEEALIKDIKDLKGELSRKAHELEALTLRLNFVTEQAEKAKGTNTEYQNTNKELSDKINSLNMDIYKIELEKKNLDQKLKEMAPKLEKSDNQLNQFRQEVATLTEQAKSLNAMVAQKDGKIKELGDKIARQKEHKEELREVSLQAENDQRELFKAIINATASVDDEAAKELRRQSTAVMNRMNKNAKQVIINRRRATMGSKAGGAKKGSRMKYFNLHRQKLLTHLFELHQSKPNEAKQCLNIFRENIDAANLMTIIDACGEDSKGILKLFYVDDQKEYEAHFKKIVTANKHRKGAALIDHVRSQFDQLLEEYNITLSSPTVSSTPTP